MKKRDVALVLSSGGAKGFAHIGVINALKRHGFNIHSVAGASMGSLIGGLYTTGELDNFVDFMDNMDLREMMKLIDITISSKGLIKGDKVIAKLKELIPDRNIEDLKLPYCAVATDIVSGEEKVFTDGKLYDAIRASISIPTVFTPHVIDGHYYVDGGVVNPIPVNRVKRKWRDIVVAVNVNAMIPVKKKPEPKKVQRKYPEQLKLLIEKIENIVPKNRADHIGIFNLTNKSLNLMLNQISELTLKLDPPDIQIDLSVDAFGMFDFYKAKEIIESGDIAAEKAIKKYLKR
ncbi:MAG: patatin-like phospholipase family protein [Candidatus Marinimicrobia bacterium]|nr:patatin-like phospholipase family protein [Candidatus Neomarinimicrobiota bacterium]